jgi:hypothetical protein
MVNYYSDICKGVQWWNPLVCVQSSIGWEHHIVIGTLDLLFVSSGMWGISQQKRGRDNVGYCPTIDCRYLVIDRDVNNHQLGDW